MTPKCGMARRSNSAARSAARPTVLFRSETSLSDDESSNDSSRDSFSSSSSSSPGRFVQVLETKCAEANELRRRNEVLSEIPVNQVKSLIVETTIGNKGDKTIIKKDVCVEVDLAKYMASREMTPFQERVNALTVMPGFVFCLVFLLTGSWMSKDLVAEAMKNLEFEGEQDLSAAFQDSNTCIDWSSLPLAGGVFQNLHAIPPLSVIAVILGIVAHAPFSFLYHWKYAHVLSPAERTNHWSRRMDQSMLHVQSCLSTYATSGALDFFLVNALFNADSIYRQFEKVVRPRRNQGRLGVAIVAWTIPILKRGDFEMFTQVFSLLAFGIFLFIRYPIGGWSHAAFHLVLVPLMPMLMQIALELDSAQDELAGAARCYALAELRSGATIS